VTGFVLENLMISRREGMKILIEWKFDIGKVGLVAMLVWNNSWLTLDTESIWAGRSKPRKYRIGRVPDVKNMEASEIAM
jgi:hypothetical protein